jgi:protein YibB
MVEMQVATLPEDLVDIAGIFHAGEAGSDPAPDAHTIVTGYFDLGREGWLDRFGKQPEERRDAGVYFERFAHLARLPNAMVVVTEPRFAAKILAIRERLGLADRTAILTVDDLFGQAALAPALRAISARMTHPFFQRMLRAPELPEFRQPRYVLLVTLKFLFVVTALRLGLIRTAQASWVDFGYCRTQAAVEATAPWRFDTGGKINLFHVLEPDDAPIFGVVRSGEMYFIANHMMGPAAAWPDFARDIAYSLDCLLECGLADDEQTLMLMAWRRNPQAYVLHPLAPKCWFTTFAPARRPVSLPQSRISAARPLWFEECVYALARSGWRERWARARRGLKRRLRALLRRGAPENQNAAGDPAASNDLG